MSFFGGAGGIRTHVLDWSDSERNPSVSVQHLFAKNGEAVRGPKRLDSQPKSGRSMHPMRHVARLPREVSGDDYALVAPS